MMVELAFDPSTPEAEKKERKRRACCIAWDGPKLKVLLPQHPKSWDYRPMLNKCTTYFWFLESPDFEQVPPSPSGQAG